MTQTCSDRLAGAAARGAQSLSTEGRQRIVAFLRAQQAGDGGFRGRSSASDLYYTHFAVQALLALDEPLPAPTLKAYLRDCGRAVEPGLVELACLAGLSVALGEDRPDSPLLRHIEAHRTRDGGYSEKRNARESSAYGCFLALLAHEALAATLPDVEAFGRALRAMTPTVTTAVAAQAIMLMHLGIHPGATTAQRLLGRASGRGGIKAASLVPVSDLLSTATALCALSAIEAPLDAVREPCIDFVSGLWHDSGGFCGHWLDRTPDCEYTYYALLALGVLTA